MLCALLPLSTTLALAAAPAEVLQTHALRREWIAPEARVVVHFDFAGFRQTTLWKLLLEDEVHLELDDLEDLRRELGLDPLHDLVGITAYSAGEDLEEGVALITATAAVDQAIEHLRGEDHLHTLLHEGLELHRLGEDGHDGAFAYVHPLTTGGRLVVLSDSARRTAAAARIVRGEAPGHDEAQDPVLSLTPGAGSILYVTAADVPGIDGLKPASRFFGLTKNVEIDVGETGGALRLHVSILTATPEDALQASKMAEGFKALAYFAAQELGEARGLLDAIRINARGNTLLVDFEYDVPTLIEHLESLEDLGNF